MILLQINVTANSGSTGRIAEDIGLLSMNNGWESYIAYGRTNNNSRNKVIRIGSDFDIKVHGLLTRVFDNHSFGFSSKWATKKLIKEIDNIKPDIIHLHNIHGYYINSKVLFEYLSKLNIPIVWTFHDCWSFTGHCAYFDAFGCERWRTGCYSCPQKKSYPSSFVFDRSKKNYKEKKQLFNSVKNLTIVPVSHWLGDLVKESFLSSNAIKVIHNGIDINTFKPSNNIKGTKEKFGLKDEYIILGVASPWSERKGLKDFIKLSTLIDENTKIILVGLNQNQIDDLPNNIIGIRRTENVNQLADLYSISDLFLNLTYQDNFPTTNLEALACGTPILTYKTGGSIEAVSEDTGFIVEKGDLDSVIKVINEVREKGKGFYSDECREKAVGCFNKNDRFMDYIDLYRSLL